MEGREPSLDALLRQHGGEAQGARALAGHLPAVEPEDGDVLLGVQAPHVLHGLAAERLPRLRPVEPLERAVLELQIAQRYRDIYIIELKQDTIYISSK